jgi:alpha-L-rhamnosidase
VAIMRSVLSVICVASGLVIAENQPVYPDQQSVSFASAQPIWPQGRECEKNLTLRFRVVFDRPAGETSFLRITGSTLYRIYFNRAFLGHGPARAGHGYYRVDQWPLSRERLEDQNLITIDVAGYNVNSYYVLDQPSFLQAEIISDGKVVASTAGEGARFEARILTERVQKVQRYSFQRPFIEYYRMGKDCTQCHYDPQAPFAKLGCTVLPKKDLIPRGIAYPRFNRIQPVAHVAAGKIEQGIELDRLWKDRSLVNIGPKLKGYREEELAVIPSIELQRIRTRSIDLLDKAYASESSFPLKTDSFRIIDLGTNLTGFIGLRVHCKEKTKLYISFDEILSQGDVDFKRLGCVNAIGYELEAGDYPLESFEPYTLRYAKVMVLQGSCTISGVYLREIVNDETDEAQFACSNNRLNRIFEAARQTFKQNSLDIFMDCPSRERAGWLCDSFFTARVAYDLTGHTDIEKNFIENFLLPPKFEHLPQGMLPMCYPADHNDEVFIPNWAMWFVVQLEEYAARSGDTALVRALQPKVMALIDYFKPFKNQDGLLEKLEGWVFVEWSQANSLVQDLSYPSNMLYAKMLTAAGSMYQKPDLIKEAQRIKALIRRQSFDGAFFVDNALRQEGKLKVTDNHTEICQYAAFYFDIATPHTHPALWQKLHTDFGPQRPQTKAFPEVHPANAFIGNYLRLELLSRYGLNEQLTEEIAGYFLYMADKTGTLWENISTTASCNHGFASHTAHCLYRDTLGIYAVNRQEKTVTLRFADVGLDWCRGTMPTPDGPLSLSWRKENDTIIYNLDLPAGYTLDIQNTSNEGLKRE